MEETKFVSKVKRRIRSIHFSKLPRIIHVLAPCVIQFISRVIQFISRVIQFISRVIQFISRVIQFISRAALLAETHRGYNYVQKMKQLERDNTLIQLVINDLEVTVFYSKTSSFSLLLSPSPFSFSLLLPPSPFSCIFKFNALIFLYYHHKADERNHNVFERYLITLCFSISYVLNYDFSISHVTPTVNTYYNLLPMLWSVLGSSLVLCWDMIIS